MNTPYLYHLGNYHLGPIVFLRGNAKIVKQACSYKFYFYMQEEVTEFQLYGETCFCVSAAQKNPKKQSGLRLNFYFSPCFHGNR